MLVASILSGITDAITSAIGDYGLYAVFLLMLVDAVLPAASEVVMVYAGAVAAGAFAGQDVVLFGSTIDDGLAAYVAMALAGTIGYTIGSIGGWAIGLYGGRPTWSATVAGFIWTRRSSIAPNAGSSNGRTGPFSSDG